MGAAARRGALAAALAAGLAACAPAPPAPRSEAESRHVVEGEELRATMRELDLLRHGRLPQELDLEPERAAERSEIVRQAQAIAERAVGLAAAAPLASLPPEDRARFEALAAALRREADALAADGEHLSAPVFDARLAELDALCEDCHRSFRRPHAVPSAP